MYHTDSCLLSCLSLLGPYIFTLIPTFILRILARYEPKECGASITCNAIKSGAGCLVLGNSCLILSLSMRNHSAVRMWACIPHSDSICLRCYFPFGTLVWSLWKVSQVLAGE